MEAQRCRLVFVSGEEEEEEEKKAEEEEGKEDEKDEALKNTKLARMPETIQKTGQKTVSGPSRGSLGRPWETLWEVLECLGRSRWGLGGVLGTSLGVSWAVLGGSWEGLGRAWEDLGGDKGKSPKNE